jgi:RNA polymerase sigma-70 factor (ECF subfamily)
MEGPKVLIAQSQRERLPMRTPPDSEARPASSTNHNNRDWSAVVTRIREGDRSAEAELYEVFTRGIRLFITRQLGTDRLEDDVRECYLVTLEAIQNGRVREPERLMGFVRTVVQRKICGQIEERVEERRRILPMDYPAMDQFYRVEAGPECAMIERQRIERMRKEVEKLSPRDREVLTRFYLQQQTKEQICAEMNLTETQFRLAKSRSKAKLTANTQRLRVTEVRRRVDSEKLVG